MNKKQIKKIPFHILSFTIKLIIILKFIKISSVISRIFNKNQDTIVWVPHIYNPFYLVDDSFIKDMGNIAALIKIGINFSIRRKIKDNDLNNKKIIFQISRCFNSGGVSKTMDNIIAVKKLRNKHASTFPNEREICFWENKIFMHQEFDRLNINTPKTLIKKNTLDEYDSISKYFENKSFLIKEIHSAGSAGIHKINSEKQFCLVLNNIRSRNSEEGVIFQEIINMRKDLRVILLGNSVIQHYWRINKSKEWRPTSTGYGSEVDFLSFPENWKQEIINNFLKLEINTGAFDICWQDDDLSTNPIFLEVSSSYQPNPKISHNQLEKYENYGNWKKSLGLSKNSYIYSHIENILNIQNKFIKLITRY